MVFLTHVWYVCVLIMYIQGVIKREVYIPHIYFGRTPIYLYCFLSVKMYIYTPVTWYILKLWCNDLPPEL